MGAAEGSPAILSDGSPNRRTDNARWLFCSALDLSIPARSAVSKQSVDPVVLRPRRSGRDQSHRLPSVGYHDTLPPPDPLQVVAETRFQFPDSDSKHHLLAEKYL